jgi:hypothetical protein
MSDTREPSKISMQDADIARAAQLLGCEPAAVRAVAAVESAGEGFDNGKPKILFEAHVFSRLTRGRFDETHPDISSRKWNRALYKGGSREHDRLARAYELDTTAALQSASWGKFQIMGFNYARCGFAHVFDFVDAMYRSEGAQLTAFCHFVKSMGLDDELRRHEWSAFARGYNGPEFATNNYDGRLAQAFGHFQSIEGLTK